MRQIIKHLDLIIYKAWADLRSEARRYYISYLWWILDPLLEMAVFYIVFGVFRKSSIPDFVPFLLIGVTIWKWFTTTVQHGATSIVNSKGVIQQVDLPKVIFPVIVVFTDTFKFCIVFLILTIYLFCYGFGISQAYLFLPLILLCQLLLIFAVSFLFALIIPFYPDAMYFIRNLLRLGMFLSGIFFAGQNLTPGHQFWFYLNPMAVIIESYRDVLMYSSCPDLLRLSWVCLGSLLGVKVSMDVIRKYDKFYARVLA